MKKRNKTKKNDSANGVQRLPALVVLALVVLAIGAISAVSKQLVSGKQSGDKSTSKESSKKYMTAKVAGQDAQVDPQTGKVKPLNAQEAEQLAPGLKKMLNKSADGLTEVQNADGSVSMDLEGRYRHVTVARVNEDGTVTTSCVDNPRAAASALGIDPKLLGVEGTPGAPTKPAPARQKN
ncbi:MAG TPA: hypothetical protein VGQ41_09980 [Pyrinomonadaceae bacterium]|jgi:hypothetical protein|nr:hypothetical protein [Pyrinomonadaceae bacterium]